MHDCLRILLNLNKRGQDDNTITLKSCIFGVKTEIFVVRDDVKIRDLINNPMFNFNSPFPPFSFFFPTITFLRKMSNTHSLFTKPI